MQYDLLCACKVFLKQMFFFFYCMFTLVSKRESVGNFCRLLIFLNANIATSIISIITVNIFSVSFLYNQKYKIYFSKKKDNLKIRSVKITIATITVITRDHTLN